MSPGSVGDSGVRNGQRSGRKTMVVQSSILVCRETLKSHDGQAFRGLKQHSQCDPTGRKDEEQSATKPKAPWSVESPCGAKA